MIKIDDEIKSNLKSILKNITILVSIAFVFIALLSIQKKVIDHESEKALAELEERIRVHKDSSFIINNLIDQSQWQCVEYANKTEINPEWLENCCVMLGSDLTDENPSYASTIKFGNYEYNVKFSKNTSNVYIQNQRICFEANQEIESMQYEGEIINMTLCSQTPEVIPTNETICIQKRLKGY